LALGKDGKSDKVNRARVITNKASILFIGIPPIDSEYLKLWPEASHDADRRAVK
jgi:hypothetical protein